MQKVRVEDAVGQILIHDIARIVIGEVKDTPFRRGHKITEEDIPALLALGKEHIFIDYHKCINSSKGYHRRCNQRFTKSRRCYKN